MDIRQYKPTDLEHLLRTWELASHVGHPFLSKDFLKSEKRNIPTVYLPSGEAWVAIVERELVGFTILHGDEVGALFVNPEYHGMGVGFELMNRARELHGQLKVEVFKDNVKGNKFYSRYGFVLKREYRHQETGMIMLCLEYQNDSQQTLK